MSFLLLSSGQASAVILLNALLGKLFMTFAFRIPIVTSSKVAKQDILNGKSFQTAHAAQLNEAEWSPLFLAALLYFHSQGVALPIASSFAAYGSVWYLWAMIFLPFPSHLPGAIMRYLSLGLLCQEFFKLAF